MNREYHKWFSPSLQRDMELLIFGENGTPVIIFPTLRGRFYEFEDQEIISLFQEEIENKELHFFCVDSVDSESWCNYDAHPSERPKRHGEYEKYIKEEVLPLVREKNLNENLILLGCDFGGYHAVNFSLRHPEIPTRCISVGGNFDIRQYMYGYFDDNSYYNSPLDFLPNLTDEAILSSIREHLKFIFGTGENDFALASNVQLSRIFDNKGISHWLDICRDGTGHGWQWWKEMLKKYLRE